MIQNVEDKAALLHILLHGLLYFIERSKASEECGRQDNHFSDFETLNDLRLLSLKQFCVRSSCFMQEGLQLRFL